MGVASMRKQDFKEWLSTKIKKKTDERLHEQM